MISFEEFLDMFSLKRNVAFKDKDVEIKNAFRLLSKEYNDEKAGMIKIDRI